MTPAAISQTFKYLVLAILASLVYLVFAAVVVPPGVISVDEVLYYLAAEALVETGTFALQNGYPELPSPAFLWRGNTQMAFVHNGQLYSQYPVGYELIAYPFFRLMKGQGLVLMNAIAFVGSLWLVYLLSVHIYRQRQIGLAAVLVYGLATPSIGYSLAIWPHSLSAFLCILAVAVLIVPKREDRFFLSGLICGLGLAVRYDLLFILVSLLTAILLSDIRYRYRKSGLFLLGVLPGLLLLSASQYLKFENFWPLTYGPHPSPALAGKSLVLLPAATALFALIVVTKTESGRRLFSSACHSRAGAVLFALALAGFFILFAPERAMNVFGVLVSFTWESLYPREQQAFEATPYGGFAPLGVVKKALLQSSPILVLSLFPLFRVNQVPLLIRFALILCPLSVIGFYSYLGWHGGFSTNQRYLTLVLPMLSILCAPAVASVFPLVRSARLGLALSLVFFTLAIAQLDSPLEYLFRYFPLMLSLVLMLLKVAKWQRKAFLFFLAASLGWSICMSVTDLTTELGIRRSCARFSNELQRVITSKSVILSTSPLSPFLLREEEEVELGSLNLLEKDDLVSFVQTAHNRNYHTYLLMFGDTGPDRICALFKQEFLCSSHSILESRMVMIEPIRAGERY